MSYQEDIMYWYKNCGHEIIISQNNISDNYTGVAICKDTFNTYKVSGKDKIDVLHDLKCMLNGNYYK